MAAIIVVSCTVQTPQTISTILSDGGLGKPAQDYAGVEREAEARPVA
jgi:hypothetical protein